MPADGAQPLRLEETEQSGLPIVRPVGEVDIASVGLLRERLDGWLAAGKRWLIVDLSATAYLDSTGLGCITAARKKAQQAGGGLVVVCDQPRILKLFTITGMDTVFTIRDSLAAALAVARESQG